MHISPSVTTLAPQYLELELRFRLYMLYLLHSMRPSATLFVALKGRREDAVQDAVRDAGREERLTVAEAAERLGITKEAVRKRIHRGTLHSDKDDGTVRVYIPPSRTPSGTASMARDELVDELRDRVRSLEGRLDEEREARRRADTIIAQLTQANATLAARVPELEASQEPPGGPQSAAEEETGRGTAPPDQHGAEPRPWWRRVFGG